MARAVAPLVPLLLDNLDRAYRGRSWHGTALRGTLRGITVDTALWRPGPGRNCIWDLLLHAAYWKYVVRRKLTGEPRGAFAREGSNFPECTKPADARALRADMQLLDAEHQRLRDAVAGLLEAELRRKRGAWRLQEFVLGAAAHDLYHAGQINLIKRLHSRR